MKKVYSKSVSSIRQSIEILFNWLIESSGIQTASKVRSTKGLFVHVFGRFSASLLSTCSFLNKTSQLLTGIYNIFHLIFVINNYIL